MIHSSETRNMALFCDFENIAQTIVFGLKQFSEAYYPVILSVAALSIIYGILYWMYKKETFVKV